MSEAQLKAFLEQVKADTSLQEKLKAAASPEAAIEIAKEAGFSITSEDIQELSEPVRELSDEELEGAAGGIGILLRPTPRQLNERPPTVHDPLGRCNQQGATAGGRSDPY